MIKTFLILFCIHMALSQPDALFYKTNINDLLFEDDVQLHFPNAYPFISADSEDASWSYDDEEDDGPEMWGKSYTACSGRFQSPIDLNYATFIKRTYPNKLEFHSYESIPKSVKIINTGHTVQLDLSFDEDHVPKISGGPLNGDFEFKQMHFHWGATNNVGSEHFWDGEPYAMEAHLVHFNKKYGTFEKAMSKIDGLAVVGTFFNVVQATPYITFTMYLEIIREAHESATLVGKIVTLSSIVGSHMDHFATYVGSLTTPPCYESVQWIISTQIQYITPDEIEEFRQLDDSHEKTMVNNYRPLQKLNNRIVYYSGVSSLFTTHAVHFLLLLGGIILLHMH